MRPREMAKRQPILITHGDVGANGGVGGVGGDGGDGGCGVDMFFVLVCFSMF